MQSEFVVRKLNELPQARSRRCVAAEATEPMLDACLLLTKAAATHVSGITRSTRLAQGPGTELYYADRSL